MLRCPLLAGYTPNPPKPTPLPPVEKNALLPRCRYAAKQRDIKGTTIGFLEILDVARIGKNGGRAWRCRCKAPTRRGAKPCMTIVVYPESDLVRARHCNGSCARAECKRLLRRTRARCASEQRGEGRMNARTCEHRVRGVFLSVSRSPSYSGRLRLEGA